MRYDLQEDLKEIFRNLQKTVVLVTHDMGEAAFFANDVLLMAHGKIAQRGAIEDFLDSPASDFVSRFIRAQRFPKLNWNCSQSLAEILGISLDRTRYIAYENLFFQSNP